VSSRIHIVNRVISAITVAVEALGVIGGLDYCVGSDEAAYFWVVVPCAVEIQAGFVKLLAGEIMVNGCAGLRVSEFVSGKRTIRSIFAVLNLEAVLVGDDIA
jgi:hypothetical protein